jgi:uncharacterized protein (UPF0262 family)
MSSTAKHKLSDISLDGSIGRATPDIEHERAIAIFDLIEENSFELVGHDTGPYKLKLSVVETRLAFDISDDDPYIVFEPISSDCKRLLYDLRKLL